MPISQSTATRARARTPHLVCLVVTALAISGFRAGPAPAAYFVEGVQLNAAETVAGGVSTIAIQAVWNNAKMLRMECTSSKLRGAAIEPMGASKAELVLEGCKNGLSEIVNRTKIGLAMQCEVSNTPTMGMAGLLVGFGLTTGNLWQPAANMVFGEVEIKAVAGGGGCLYGAALGTKYKLRGIVAAWYGAGGELENAEHDSPLLPCTSSLSFENKDATIEGTLVKLELSGAMVGQRWSATR